MIIGLDTDFWKVRTVLSVGSTRGVVKDKGGCSWDLPEGLGLLQEQIEKRTLWPAYLVFRQT